VSLLLRTLQGLDLRYPEITPEERQAIHEARKEMEREDS
jgi:hypothetical protein